MVHVPRVSIGLPVFNGESFVREAIESARAQSLEDIEIVISDNASTDGTEAICRAAAATDDRISYHRHDVNRGGPWNFNFVTRAARAPFVAWLAADDMFQPSFLEVCLAELERRGPDVVLCFGGTQLIDSDSRPIGRIEDTDLDLDEPVPHRRVRTLLDRNAGHLMHSLIRRESLERTRGVRANAASDVVVLVELACLGRFVRVPDDVVLGRRHPAQASAQGQHQVRWYRPDARTSRFALMNTRVVLDLTSAVLRSPLPAAERFRALGALGPAWLGPHRDAYLSDLRTLVRVPQLRRG